MRPRARISLVLVASLFLATPAAADEPGQRFTADPVADTGIVALGLTFGVLSSSILGTGEIRPQQISPGFDAKSLLGIDRGAIRQSIDSNASTFSNLGLYTAAAFAVADTALDFFREGHTAVITDAVMYAEAVTIALGVTNVAKIAFRRPRPIAYIDRDAYLARGGDPSTYDNANTDSALSFFSGHASTVAAIASSATYIAFRRSPRSVRPWLTLAGGFALTGFVSYERVRAGAHFPTDVIAGALAGAGIGALVVHLHREDSLRERPIWIGVTPMPEGGGVLGAGGRF